MISQLRTAYRIGTTEGLRGVLQKTAIHFSEARHERWFGIRTGREIYLDTVGINDPDAVRYCATNYSAFFKAANLLDQDTKRGVFVDYGAGLGRIVCCAASLGFKKVVGVELSDKLASTARNNVETARKRFPTADVSILNINATEWPVDDAVTVFHFYNPFLNETLKKVLANIADSLKRVPRKAIIMASCPWQINRFVMSGDIFPVHWIKERKESPWPYYDDISEKDPNGDRYRLYFIEPR